MAQETPPCGPITPAKETPMNPQLFTFLIGEIRSRRVDAPQLERLLLSASRPRGRPGRPRPPGRPLT
jgi:hypothetical protein